MSDEPHTPDVIAPIRNRSAQRAFATDAPSAAELASLFAAASLAPSAGNAQPWRFVLARRGTESHAALGTALRSSNRWASAAPLLVATAVRTMHVHPTKPPKANRLALFELGLATGNLLAQATALDLIARPAGGFDRASVRRALAVPEAWELGVLLAIGRAGGSAPAEGDASVEPEPDRDRLAWAEIVFEGRWGRATEVSGPF